MDSAAQQLHMKIPKKLHPFFYYSNNTGAFSSSSSALPLLAMESSTKPSATPLHAFSSFFHTHLSRIGSDISARFEEAKRNLANAVTYRPVLEQRHVAAPPFASVLHDSWQPKHAFDVALGADYVAKTLAGTAVYTVSNSNNEFVLISDPGSVKSLSLLCFRQEDAEALLAQVLLFPIPSHL